MIPKGAKYANKVFIGKTGEERVRELLDDTDPKTVFLPESIGIVDLDTEIVNVLNNGNLSVTSDSRKEKVPAYLFGAEKWSEFAKTWQYTDDDKNLIFPIVTIRKTETKFGSRLGENRHFISNQRTYEYTRVPVKDKNNGVIGYEIYKIPNPTPIDITYEIRMFSDFSRDINKFDEKFMRQFQDNQFYINVKGHYMPIFLQGGSEENETDLEKTNYLVRIHNITLRGFIIDENDFEVVRANERLIKIIEINGVGTYQAPINNIISGCTFPSATNYNPAATIDNGSCTFPSGTTRSGCTNPLATNYNQYATVDDGSCIFPTGITIYGCMNSGATNYYSAVTIDNGSCIFPTGTTIYGCTNPLARNYYSAVTVDDGSCIFPTGITIYGCTNPLARNYYSAVTVDDGSCVFPSGTTISGCTNPLATNYNQYATVDNGSCVFISGCTFSSATNYNSAATIDNGSCTFPSGTTISGCTNTGATNYNQYATVDDGSCILPAKTYSISATAVNRELFSPFDYIISSNTGDPNVYFTITTTNVQNGTILYWNNIGTFDGNFFTVSSNTGTTVINNNTANFTRVVSNRYICTNVEFIIRTIILELRTESQSGPIVATANTVKVDLPFCP
jgi:hypothetical protein